MGIQDRNIWNNANKKMVELALRKFDEKKKYSIDSSKWVPTTYMIDLKEINDEEILLFKVKNI